MITRSSPAGFAEMAEGVRLKTLVHGAHTHLTEVRLERGALIPEHAHEQEQTGYLISGRLRFFSGDEEAIAGPGDSWTLPGGFPHGAEALEDTVVVEVFSPIRPDLLDPTGD